MAKPATVRNSRILGVFDEILHAPQCGLRAVEIAGRGIAGEARCTLAALADKDRRYTGTAAEVTRRAIAYSDRLVELGEIEDDLVDAWHRRSAGESDDAAFERALLDIVVRLEAWPRRLSTDDIGTGDGRPYTVPGEAGGTGGP
ncbi:hypothetical protein [Micromonospora sp. NPDC047074]|uniref:hypothetical protein n=1 Tax=Micromonospora sp. NPDC047074 TaxID=3154339 RepID=UPI0033EF2E76